MHGIILSGKTAEIVHQDSTGANVSRDITRQVLGRIPGVNISELGTGGFPSNGVGFRGLNPTQSLEVNVRQNGVNIAGDLYGYNETYYAPPSELIDDILVVRGAASLAYGPQFGGALDYLLKHGTPHAPPTVEVEQSAGSFGLFNTFGSVGGGTGPLTYYAALHHRSEQGARLNADYDQTDAYGRADLQLSTNTSVGIEYTRFRNRIHMPGGLTDAEFDANPEASFRSRNWLATPWNILEAHLDSKLADRAHLYLTSSLMRAQRYLVWRNEDGGPQAADSIDPATNQFIPREVEREAFANVTNEARLVMAHSLLTRPNRMTIGVREFSGDMHRQDGGVGSTGNDFDMTLLQPYGTDLHFGTVNVATFVEDLWHLTDRWSVTPGVRAEWLRSTIHGVDNDATTTVPSQAKNRTFALAGIGSEYVLGSTAVLYANWSQAYRPVTYDLLTPFGSAARIAPDLSDGHGYDVDLGVRGTFLPGVSGSLTGFYLVYGNRVGLYSAIDTTQGSTFTEEANIGNSVAKGVEAYVSLVPAMLFGRKGLEGWTLFDATAYDDARYTSGSFSSNVVERAPSWIHRAGITYASGLGSTTLQVATQSHSYTDANNTISSPDDADVGLVPSFTVIDWSVTLLLARQFRTTFAINNLANVHYFTDRSVEYPGPGIMPSPGRAVTFGVTYVTP